MASTGESACLGKDLLEVYLKSLLSVDFIWPRKNVLLTLGGVVNKINFLESAQLLAQSGYRLYSTDKTHLFLKKHRIKSTKVFKEYEKGKPNVIDLIKEGCLGLVINLSQAPDGELDRKIFQKIVRGDYLIRRASADFHVPLITNLQSAELLAVPE